MTTRNNFTRAPANQPNIIGTLFYDTDLGRRNFKENIEVLQSAVGYYIDNGNLPGIDAIKFRIKGTRAALVKYCLEQINGNMPVKTMKVNELAESILYGMEKITLANFEQESEFLAQYDLSIVPNKTLESVETRGYCQGDYARVYYCPSDCKEAWGNAANPESLEKEITRYYWDSPVYANMTIDGKKYPLWDMPSYDEYDFDRAAYLVWISSQSGIAVDVLSAILPDEPTY